MSKDFTRWSLLEIADEMQKLSSDMVKQMGIEEPTYGISIHRLSEGSLPHAYGITFTQIKIPTCACGNKSLTLVAANESTLYFFCPECYRAKDVSKFAEVKE